MTPLGVWTLIIILYQTVLCVLMSWVVLGCHLSPTANELHEVTLMKLLYLYEPEACGRMQFFNYTMRTTTNIHVSTIVWPLKNSVAAGFRFLYTRHSKLYLKSKVRLWLCLHLLWFILAVVNLTQGHRACGFYVALLPFSCTGLTLLVVDVVFTALFIRDVDHTSTELNILEYIQSGGGSLHWVLKSMRWLIAPRIDEEHIEDTSWVAVLMAYVSCRGVLQWIINLWLVKDNFIEGRLAYKNLQSNRLNRRTKSYD